MPPIEAFPKSHVVTFKYYVGVILFLDEDYIKVGNHAVACRRSVTETCCLIGRREFDRCLVNVS